MIYIILTALLAHTIFYKPSNIMACGLFGYSGPDGNNMLVRVMTILGLFNQKRGTDASGVMTNFHSEKSVSNGKFSEFIVEDLSYEEIIDEDVTVFLGHTRNASPRTKRTIDTAQPCIITKSGDEYEENFGLIHNGNISSAADRLIELGGKATGLSDSYDFHQVLELTDDIKAELANYTGKAALVWTKKDDSSTIHVFAGASRTDRNKNTKATEERPLYYIQTEDNLYFSSTYESLMAAFPYEENEVVEFKKNTLYTITKGEIISTEEVDRSKSFQNKITTYPSQTNFNYDNWDDTYGYGNRNGSTYYNSIQLRKQTLQTVEFKDRVHLKDGMYHLGKDVLSGFRFISKYGEVISDLKDYKKMDKIYLVYFNGGHIINNRGIEAFLDVQNYNYEDLAKKNTYFESQLFKTYSVTPYIKTGSIYAVTIAVHGQDLSDGMVKYPFTTFSAQFNKGNLKRIVATGSYDLIDEKTGIEVTIEQAEYLINESQTMLLEGVNQMYLNFVEKYLKKDIKSTDLVIVNKETDKLPDEDDGEIISEVELNQIEGIFEEVKNVKIAVEIAKAEIDSLYDSLDSLQGSYNDLSSLNDKLVPEKQIKQMKTNISIVKGMLQMFNSIKLDMNDDKI